MVDYYRGTMAGKLWWLSVVMAATWGGAWRVTVVIGGEWVVEIKSGWPDLSFGTRKKIAGSLAEIFSGGRMGKR